MTSNRRTAPQTGGNHDGIATRTRPVASLLASPAHAIGLALRLSRAGKLEHPSLAAALDALRHHAASGDAAAQLTLEHIEQQIERARP